MSTFLRLWDRIVYGRDHRAKWAALATIRAQEDASRPWRVVPPTYTPERLALEERWMRCDHPSGVHRMFDEFIRNVATCRTCGMSRWDGEEREGVYTFVRIRDVLHAGEWSYMTEVYSVPVRAEGRQRVRGTAIVQ